MEGFGAAAPIGRSAWCGVLIEACWAECGSALLVAGDACSSDGVGACGISAWAGAATGSGVAASGEKFCGRCPTACRTKCSHVGASRAGLGVSVRVRVVGRRKSAACGRFHFPTASFPAALRRHSARCLPFEATSQRLPATPSQAAIRSLGSSLRPNQGLAGSASLRIAGTRPIFASSALRTRFHWAANTSSEPASNAPECTGPPGVDAMAALRCCVLNHRLDDFWNRHKAQNAA